MRMKGYKLFDRNTRALVYCFQTNAIHRMLDFDYLCNRSVPSVAASSTQTGRDPEGILGTEEILLPMYKTISEAAAAHPSAEVW
jgi:hypothetical protein